MEQASVGTDQPKAEPVERSAEVSDAQRPDPSKSIPPAFHPGALAYHPHSLPAAYPFGYWTGQGAPLVYGGPFYGGILPGMFHPPPVEGPPMGTREQAVQQAVQQDAPQASDPKPDPQSQPEERLSAQTDSCQSLPDSPATHSLHTAVTTDQATSQHAPPATGFVRVQPSGGTSDDRQILPGLWRPKALPASATELQSLASRDSPQNDRETKKLRRKQSNRESARRSRLRKQAECQSLSGRVDNLQADNVRLREANKQLQARLDALQPEQGLREAAATLRSVASGERGSRV